MSTPSHTDSIWGPSAARYRPNQSPHPSQSVRLRPSPSDPPGSINATLPPNAETRTRGADVSPSQASRSIPQSIQHRLQPSLPLLVGKTLQIALSAGDASERLCAFSLAEGAIPSTALPGSQPDPFPLLPFFLSLAHPEAHALDNGLLSLLLKDVANARRAEGARSASSSLAAGSSRGRVAGVRSGEPLPGAEEDSEQWTAPRRRVLVGRDVVVWDCVS